jgi:peroxiredoxin
MDSMIATGEPAPQIRLVDLAGQEHSLQDMRGRIVILNFWSADCPWCERIDHELLDCLPGWLPEVMVWWIASNAHETLDQVKQAAAERHLPTVMMDRNLQAADVYGALTTPHFFVIDQQGSLAYQGAWDDITFRQRVATEVFVPRVIQALLENRIPPITQTPPYGCALVRSFEAGS